MIYMSVYIFCVLYTSSHTSNPNPLHSIFYRPPQVLAKYPNGALFLFFAGRLQEMRGNLDQAVLKFEASIDSQSQWQQVKWGGCGGVV